MTDLTPATGALAPAVVIAPEAASVAAACKAAFLPILEAHGIARVVVAYDGGGDEGQVQDTTAWNAAGETVALPAIDCARHVLYFDGSVRSDVVALEEALDSFAVTVLCTQWAGWEDGEGACGELEILVAGGHATLTHNSRFVDYEQHITEI
jgi:hypothetical protein